MKGTDGDLLVIIGDESIRLCASARYCEEMIELILSSPLIVTNIDLWKIM